MARFSMRRSVVAAAVAACAVVVLGEDAKAVDPEAQKKVNQAAALESMTKWASVLANSFMASGSPDKAVQSIAQFHSVIQDELASQAKKWSSFQTTGGSTAGGATIAGGNGGTGTTTANPDPAADLAAIIRDGGPLHHPIPEISITDPKFFADGTANVTSDFAGASLSSAFISYSPCVFPETPTGFGVFPQGINIEPQIVGANPQAFNVQPQGLSVAPTLILVAPIAANVQPQGFNIAPTLISVSPIRTVVSHVGPVNVAPTLISATLPRIGGP